MTIFRDIFHEYQYLDSNLCSNLNRAVLDRVKEISFDHTPRRLLANHGKVSRTMVYLVRWTMERKTASGGAFSHSNQCRFRKRISFESGMGRRDVRPPIDSGLSSRAKSADYPINPMGRLLWSHASFDQPRRPPPSVSLSFASLKPL